MVVNMLGRLQLIKSVLLAIQVFWSQIFILPRAILTLIDSLCRRFLWTYGIDVSKKALVAWKVLCWPRTTGGFTDVYDSILNKKVV
ncbi:hypothetical protein H5410_046521 [Solanum commersonii]|uniref:Uncharacterized protein n=1 Tax=Solanum commersonii TaxID=4109 RepID=A0A9J5XEN3_SOLCO|nr:hypothetical protein H5410_046521 [Solanum commersonii]